MAREYVQFVEPTSLDEAETRRRQLTDEIQDIAQQLHERKQKRIADFADRHPQGVKSPRELTLEDRESHLHYMDWRSRALKSLRGRDRVLRRLNDWIKAEKRRLAEAKAPAFNPAEARDVISSVIALFIKLKAEGIDFDPDEWALVDRLNALMRGIPSEV
jgi:hypothetical protein